MTYLKHKDIYTKFMIEYDKANVTSSYPSLTEYEVATFLDKAYNALIAQKVTGNNVRRAPLEADIKAISDLQPLIHTTDIDLEQATDVASNVVKAELPDGFLYCVTGNLIKSPETLTETVFTKQPTFVGVGNNGFMFSVTELQTLLEQLQDDDAVGYNLGFSTTGSYTFSQKYYVETPTAITPYTDATPLSVDPPTYQNISLPASSGVIELLQTLLDNATDYFTNCTHVFLQVVPRSQTVGIITYDLVLTKTFEGDQKFQNAMDGAFSRITPIRLNNHQVASKFFSSTFNMPWIKIPIAYIEDDYMYIVEDCMRSSYQGDLNLTYIKKPNTFVKNLTTPGIKNDGSASYFEFNEGTTGIVPANPTVTAEDYQFECNDTVAEELVSLAITFALENVESQRLNSKLNTRGLEA